MASHFPSISSIVFGVLFVTSEILPYISNMKINSLVHFLTQIVNGFDEFNNYTSIPRTDESSQHVHSNNSEEFITDIKKQLSNIQNILETRNDKETTKIDFTDVEELLKINNNILQEKINIILRQNELLNQKSTSEDSSNDIITNKIENINNKIDFIQIDMKESIIEMKGTLLETINEKFLNRDDNKSIFETHSKKYFKKK